MKKTALIILSITAALMASAAPITPEQALQRVKQSPNKVRGMSQQESQLVLAHTTETEAGDPALYIFNRPEESGFMILSADDLAYPYLGHVDSGEFDVNNMPPAMEWWLSEYARQIAYARLHGAIPGNMNIAQAANAASRASRESIAPYLKTSWDQGEPYNNSCPLYGTDRTYTGCVATSMAQVMKYWEYPEKGVGNISYTSSSIEKKLSLNLALRKFDWNNMLPTYVTGQYNKTQADAVAYLMKACGYAVKMEYGTDSSGALAMDVRKALIKYFKYDANMRYEIRDYFSTTEWTEKMYNNLKDVGPIICGGASLLSGGHSFVCDGYEAETGFFHFNWGWTGMSNGYFSLDALNPTSLGIGGGNGGGYNFTQDAIFGLQPLTDQPQIEQPKLLTMMGSLVSQITDDILVFDLDMMSDAMWVNYNPDALRVEMGARFESATGDVKVFSVSKHRYNLDPGYGFPAHVFDNSVNPPVDRGLNPNIPLETLREELSDGSYKVTMVSRDPDVEDAPWLEILYNHGHYDYVNVTKIGDRITTKDIPAPSLDIIDANFKTTLMPNSLVKVEVTVKNPSNIEITTGLAPLLVYNGAMIYLGESIFLTAGPNETITTEWATSLTAMQQVLFDRPTEVDFLLFDEKSYLYYDYSKKVTLQPVVYPDIKYSASTTPKVTNATRQDTEKYMGLSRNTYYITDPTEINITSHFVATTEFNYKLVTCLCKIADDNVAEIMTYAGENVFWEGTRLPHTFTTTLRYPQMEPGQRYLLISGYDIPSGIMPIQSEKFSIVYLETAGVDDVTVDSDSNEPVQVYNLQGVYMGTSTEGLEHGVYIVRQGSKTTKVLK